MKDYLYTKRYGLAVLTAFLLLIAPMTLMVSHIDLLSSVNEGEGFFFSLLTNSAGSPGFLITLAVLCLVSLTLDLTPKQQWQKAVQLGIILVIGFAAKTGLKHVTESPRPYTEVLTHQLLIPKPAHFYQLSPHQQDQLITQVSNQVSPWRTQHWLGETDYSFPSGHTMFVAICLVCFGGLFIEHKRYGLAATLLIWGVAVAYSRLWIGMHRPIDLVGSAIFVALVYTMLPNFSVWLDTLFDRIESYLPSRERGV
ncbi:phosphatidylglycerophosphatase B [Vibrio ichthyoenteri ATCC 700023]|uniref:undecaprenyl-diphosphate phosphatase n=1 Tax=Vibrio ichthyoenteri ATCC 700023 TaxID=870968 RepID=F9RXJ6_9VIBR|nr:phosphatase PAP2 family protein [Vibrio ichthyoenteri]EGU47920.1 phosphatidylglycerophosphatase B [Vibrio ichthyoenteri ATCC 700023]